MKRILWNIMPSADWLLAVVSYPAAFLLRNIRKRGIDQLPHCRKAFLRAGVFPIIDHYYEPLFDDKHLRHPLSQDRNLPGIDWNVEGQLALLSQFHFEDELIEILDEKPGRNKFHFNNGVFESGDAEYWYNIIRLKKPKRIVEIGSGYSTLIAEEAIRRNMRCDSSYTCQHICIEPYGAAWLEELDVSVIRKRVEEVDRGIFHDLIADDILFIDSSHVIRPQGDVVMEYLELIPAMCAGVIVHIHDIFSPKDYLEEWITKEVRFWNEQYLLEAFLTLNRDWKIIGALNYLHHNHFPDFIARCPFVTPDREPGSFYIQKVA